MSRNPVGTEARALSTPSALPRPSTSGPAPVPTADGPPRRWFRLRGEVGGVLRTFLLPPGESRLGSLTDNDVALPVRGVSRRHAVLESAPGGLQVRDLGSKNGVLVGDRRVEQGTLEAGDRVRFGPLAFEVEEVTAGDARLAIVLPAAADTPSDDDPASPTPFLSTRGGADAGRWLDLVERVAEDLDRRPRPDLAAALARIGRRLGAVGVCLGRVGRSGVAVVLAAWGEVGEAPPSERPPAAGRVRVAGRDGPAPGLRLTVGRTDDDVCLHLDVCRPEPVLAALPAARCALRTVLRLFAATTFGAAATGGRAAAEGGHRGRGGASNLGSTAAGGAGEARLTFPPGHVLCPSAAMTALYRQMAAVAGTELPLLLGGETGVGKELLARALHLSSRRGDGPFVAVNCAAIPAELLEAEMFGIGPRVATGVEGRKGRFQLADGGTLFLDEIGDLPLPLQAKLLRALESKEIHPVGRAPQRVDVRLVAASNADLRRRAADGRFREDLFYRLAGSVLEVPPLRRRAGDVPVLVEHFVAAAAAEAGKEVRGVTWSALECLTAYVWPGNVRELQHEVRRLVHLCPAGGAVDSTLLPPRLVAGGAASGGDSTPVVEGEGSLRLEDHVVPLERRLVREALRRAGGNKSEAARLLGMSRNGLAYKLNSLGLDA